MTTTSPPPISTLSHDHAYLATVQSMNNAATSNIEAGHYQRAIWFLETALRIWEEHRSARIYDNACSDTHPKKTKTISRYSTLDGCIAFSELQQQQKAVTKLDSRKRRRCSVVECDDEAGTTTTTSKIVAEARRRTSGMAFRNDGSMPGSKRRRLSDHTSDHSTAITTTMGCHGREDEDISIDAVDGFVHRQPIYIPECHDNMGSVCFFVVLFNLALARHLKVLDDHNDIYSDYNEKMDATLREVLSLYELVFEYWTRELKAADARQCTSCVDNIGSYRFAMALFNNLAHMYGLNHNYVKQDYCLRRLLSIVMVVVDFNFMARDRTTTTSSNTMATMGAAFQQNIEGFLANAIPPEQHCAQAA